MGSLSPVDEAINSYLEEYFKIRPDHATYLGIEGYDHLLPKWDKASLEKEAELAENLVSRLEKLETTSLPDSVLIDLEVARNYMELWLHGYRIGLWRMYPEAPSVAASAIVPLMIRAGLGDSKALEALKSRLAGIPGMLEESKERLEEPVRDWLLAGAEAARSLSAIAGIAASKWGPSDPVLEDVALRAASHASAYAAWLEKEADKTGMENRVPGVSEYSVTLKLRFLPGPGEIARIAGSVAEEYEKKLLGFLAASRIQDIGESLPVKRTITGELPRVLETMRARAPRDFEEAKWLYRRFLEEAEKISQDIAPPPPQQPRLLETPEGLEALIPTAAYIPPPPLNPGQGGLLLVSRPQTPLLLGEHNPYQVCSTILREVYPGRHVITSWASRTSSLTRKVFQAPETIEAWTLYAEDAARRRGFYREPEHMVLTVYNVFSAAVRALAEVKINTGEWSLEDAAAFLAEKLAIPRDQADAEVRTYTYSQAQHAPIIYAWNVLANHGSSGEAELERNKKLLREGPLPAGILGEVL